MLISKDLLVPRYKVIAPWPDMGPQGYYDGQTITLTGAWNGQRYAVINTNHVYDAFFTAFPHLFQPLEWWQERKPEDMPEYVKCIETPDQTIMPGWVLKVRWPDAGWGRSGVHSVFPYTNCFLPATHEDYINFKNKTDA